MLQYIKLGKIANSLLNWKGIIGNDKLSIKLEKDNPGFMDFHAVGVGYTGIR
jgi:hypothetical protein